MTKIATTTFSIFGSVVLNGYRTTWQCGLSKQSTIKQNYISDSDISQPRPVNNVIFSVKGISVDKLVIYLAKS